ncbi:INSulin related [Caenorhabditis elegans]|uniref:INSulin related n=1 Tax=Caenorhabditis elegans TaxID=6239 RepID=Q9XVA1_CAEEL|nr:INSulin related [Caenorhabditis elegans]CAB04062.2 INSulin related [Caenorhabditis elegans]|eukprot:NP_496902.2 INSulin related [Caenorhabditis elegans]
MAAFLPIALSIAMLTVLTNANPIHPVPNAAFLPYRSCGSHLVHRAFEACSGKKDRSSDVDLWKMCCKDECTDLDIKESLCKYASQGYGVKFEEEAEEIDMVSFAAEGFKKSCGHDIVVKTVNVPTKISLKQCARTRGWRRRRPRRIPDKFNRVQNYACINCVKIK